MGTEKDINRGYLENLIDKIPAPIYLKDSAGTYRYVNASFATLSNHSKNAIIGKKDIDLFTRKIADLFKTQDKQVIKLKKSMDFEETISLPDGEYSFITIKFPLFDENKNHVTAVGGFCTDITLRKKADMALRECKMQSSLAIDIIDAGAWSIDMDSGQYMANHKFYEIMGYPPDDLDNTMDAIKALHHPDEWEVIREKMFDHLRGHTEQYEHKHHFKQKSGEWKWVLMKAKGIDKDKRTHHYKKMVGVTIDISDYMKTNQELHTWTRKLENKNIGLYKTQVELARIVENRNRELEQLNKYLIELEERERKSIAEEIHDVISQDLAISILKLKNINDTDRRLKPDLTKIQTRLEQTLKAIQSLTWQLSPPVLYDFDIDIALEWLMENINKNYGMHIVCQKNTGTPFKVDEAIKVILFRTVRELLLNVVKHADTTEAAVFLSSKNETLLIQVEDYGVGFDLKKIKKNIHTHFGLFSISERLNAIGGYCKFTSQEGQGTRVFLSSPMRFKKTDRRLAGDPLPDTKR